MPTPAASESTECVRAVTCSDEFCFAMVAATLTRDGETATLRDARELARHVPLWCDNYHAARRERGRTMRANQEALVCSSNRGQDILDQLRVYTNWTCDRVALADLTIESDWSEWSLDLMRRYITPNARQVYRARESPFYVFTDFSLPMGWNSINHSELFGIRNDKHWRLDGNPTVVAYVTDGNDFSMFLLNCEAPPEPGKLLDKLLDKPGALIGGAVGLLIIIAIVVIARKKSKKPKHPTTATVHPTNLIAAAIAPTA